MSKKKKYMKLFMFNTVQSPKGRELPKKVTSCKKAVFPVVIKYIPCNSH
jgi:hypothetical protein